MERHNKGTHFYCNKVQPFSFLTQIDVVKSNEPVRRWYYLDGNGNLETLICYKRHSLVTTCHVSSLCCRTLPKLLYFCVL